jgi:hypothetical protein
LARWQPTTYVGMQSWTRFSAQLSAFKFGLASNCDDGEWRFGSD